MYSLRSGQGEICNIQRKNKVKNPESETGVDVLLEGKTPLKGVWVSEQGFKRKSQLVRMSYTQSDKKRNY